MNRDASLQRAASAAAKQTATASMLLR